MASMDLDRLDKVLFNFGFQGLKDVYWFQRVRINLGYDQFFGSGFLAKKGLGFWRNREFLLADTKMQKECAVFKLIRQGRMFRRRKDLKQLFSEIKR
jgi:hypothetical protein